VEEEKRLGWLVHVYDVPTMYYSRAREIPSGIIIQQSNTFTPIAHFQEGN